MAKLAARSAAAFSFTWVATWRGERRGGVSGVEQGVKC